MNIEPVWEKKSDLPLAGGRRASGLFSVIYSGTGARWFLYGGAVAVGLVSLFTGWPGAGIYGADKQPQVITRRQVEVEVVMQQVPFAQTPDDRSLAAQGRFGQAWAPAPHTAWSTAWAPGARDVAVAWASPDTATEGTLQPATGRASEPPAAPPMVAAAEPPRSDEPAVRPDAAPSRKADPGAMALETGQPASGGDNVFPTGDAKPPAEAKPSAEAKPAAQTKPAVKPAAPKAASAAKHAKPARAMLAAAAPAKAKPVAATKTKPEVVFISSEDPQPADAPPAAPPAFAPAPATPPATAQAPGYVPLTYTPPPAAPPAPPAAAPAARRPAAPPGSPVTLVGRLAPQGSQVASAQVLLVDMSSGATVSGVLQPDGTFSFGRLRSGSLYYIVAWQHVRGINGGSAGTSGGDQRLSWHQVIEASDAGTFSVELSRANCDGEYTTDVLPASAIRSPGSGRRAELTPLGGG